MPNVVESKSHPTPVKIALSVLELPRKGITGGESRHYGLKKRCVWRGWFQLIKRKERRRGREGEEREKKGRDLSFARDII